MPEENSSETAIPDNTVQTNSQDSSHVSNPPGNQSTGLIDKLKQLIRKKPYLAAGSAVLAALVLVAVVIGVTDSVSSGNNKSSMNAPAAKITSSAKKTTAQSAQNASTITLSGSKIALSKTFNPISGSYYQQPEVLSNLKMISTPSDYFTCPDSSGSSTTSSSCSSSQLADSIAYYQVGVTGSNQPIIAITQKSSSGWDSEFPYLAIETSSGKYKLLASLTNIDNSNGKFDATSVPSSLSQGLSSNTTLDTSDILSIFVLPPTISGLPDNQTAALSTGEGGILAPDFIDGQSNLATDSEPGQNPEVSATSIGTMSGLDIINLIYSPGQGVDSLQTFGLIGGVFAVPYTYNIPSSVSWSYGSGSAITLVSAPPQGCGSEYNLLSVSGINPSDIFQVGTTPGGNPIYAPYESSSLFRSYYDGYAAANDAEDTSPGSSIVSQSTFEQEHGVLLESYASGSYYMLENSNLGSGDGCGKPVIYLYPQKSEYVSVKVGAHITKSDPAYGAYGWQNVWASPDGTIKYSGEKYSYLYWEGTGDGQYPGTDYGTVVSQAHLVTTIKKQLAQQGLDNSEIGDFLGYWQSRLPTTPYVKLTWLDTAQMNQLAPLTISPMPKTLIRVFLDAEGLQSPIKLTPQTFNAPERVGFTVVEWGGLLRMPLK